MNGSAPDVLAAVDGSWPSAAALDWAVADAEALGAGVTVCVVVDPHPVPAGDEVDEVKRYFGQKVIDAAIARARSVAPDVPVRGMLVIGPPGPELTRLAADGLQVVLGAGGLGSTERLLGSVSCHVALRAPGPVVVVRPAPVDGSTVVIGVDGHDPADRALEYGFRYAARHGLGVRALYGYSASALVPAIPPTGWVTPDGGARTAEHLVRDRLDRWATRFPDVPAAASAVEGPAAAVLADASEAAALVVVGAPDPDGFGDLLTCSVSGRLARHAHCPLVIVHRPADRSEP